MANQDFDCEKVYFKIGAHVSQRNQDFVSGHHSYLFQDCLAAAYLLLHIVITG